MADLKALIKRHDSMASARNENDTLFQELKELIRPDTTDFIGGSSPIASQRKKLYDGTASWSADQLSSGLHSYNTSPTDRWFGLTVAGLPFDQLDYSARLWLEQTSDILYAHYCDPVSSLNSALHECYLDLSVFGTGVIYQWFDVKTARLMFRAYPLADCWIDEDANGVVNRLHRRVKWTAEQIEAEFGSLPPKLAKIRDEKKNDEMFDCFHCVYPNDDYEPGSRSPKRRRYASCWFVKQTEEELGEPGGYDWMPYHTPRWTKLAGEKYGRGPALTVLPEIRMVNAMRKTLISAAQKMADPPLQLPDDGYMLPIRQTPGGLNFKRSGTEEIKPLPTAQRVDVTVEMIEQSREMIRRGFFVDWLVRPTKKERQTAQEINDDRNQMLSMMAPITGRVQGELCGPMLRYSYYLLDRHGMLAQPPQSLQGTRMDVAYLSPAARAQATVRGQGLNAFVDRLVQLQPVMPTALDSIDEDAFIKDLADYFDVPRRDMASPEVVAQRQQARAQQQQQQAMIEAAPAVGTAADKLASAQQKGLRIF